MTWRANGLGQYAPVHDLFKQMREEASQPKTPEFTSRHEILNFLPRDMELTASNLEVKDGFEKSETKVAHL